MSPAFAVRRLERRRVDQQIEVLEFRTGVNLLLGLPNSGKTTWLRMLDFLLGDTDTVEEKLDADLIAKYESVTAHIDIDHHRITLQREWNGSKPKTKIGLNDEWVTPKDIQHQLLESTGIPLLHFPKGNPYSGQTWPELSFRMLLRHMYRQQKYWGDIADQQPDSERTACILQFLGVAELLFTTEYGHLVTKKIELEGLRARRQQFFITLNELAKEILGEFSPQAVTRQSLASAEEELSDQLQRLEEQREAVIASARDEVIGPDDREVVLRSSEERVRLLHIRDELLSKINQGQKREGELSDYSKAVTEEHQRLLRATDASKTLADLKITHCPACDQPISALVQPPGTCILCHQTLGNQPDIFSSKRLDFEMERVNAELAEAQDLLQLVRAENGTFLESLRALDERLLTLDNELRSAKTAVSGLIQSSVSVLDRKLGEISERQRQLLRIKGALELGEKLDEQIDATEREIEPLQEEVDTNLEKVDFPEAAQALSEGITEYLNLINKIRPGTWKHSRVQLNLSQSQSRFRIGGKNWANALGGTDQLYFLMAYHYGLLALMPKSGCHYPGIAIIDTPGEFAGESIRDLENFIVEPFIELLSRDDMQAAQVIITGSAFQGLPSAHRIELSTVWTA